MIKYKLQNDLWHEFNEASDNKPENLKQFKELIDYGIELEVPDAEKLEQILQPSQATLGMFGHRSDFLKAKLVLVILAANNLIDFL